MKLNRLSFRTLIVLGFSILSLIILIISILSIIKIRQISHNTEFIYRHSLTVGNSVRDINTYINAIHRSMKDVALAEDSIKLNKAIGEVEEYNKAALELFRIVSERF